MSPCGRTFSQEVATGARRSATTTLILVCGHYEGVDQRFLDACVDEEVSHGATSSSPAGRSPPWRCATPCAGWCRGFCRMRSASRRSPTGTGLLEYPSVLPPRRVARSRAVPEVLLSGDHGKVAAWRRKESYKRTMRRRPDLFARFDETQLTTKAERKILQQAKEELEAEKANGGEQPEKNEP